MDSTVEVQQVDEAPGSARIHYLDWLRVIAILMVFLYHAVHPFDIGDWQVKNVEQSEVLTIVLTILSLWGMPFFFLVAGAGSWFALLRRTGSQYLKERFYRLVIPFFVGTLLFSPIEYYCEKMNKIQRGVETYTGSFLSLFSSFNPKLLEYPGISPKWMGHGYHLWFLGFLFFFALITLPLFLWFKQENGKRLLNRIARWSEFRGGILLFIIPIALVKLLVTPFFMMEHDWGDFTFQMSFFILGFIIFSDERFAKAIRRDWWILLVLPTLGILGLLGMYLADIPVYDLGYTPTSPMFYLIHTLISIIAVCYSLLMIYVGMRFLNFTNKWLIYGQEAALPFFVLHQPVIIVVAFFVVQTNSPLMVKLPVVVLGSFFITLGLVEFVIKRFRLLRLAFGMKSGPVVKVKPGTSTVQP